MASDDRRRAIGKVVSVAADHFTVELHRGGDNFTVVGFDDMHYVAQIGAYLVIPVQSEYVVAEVVGLREKEAPQNRVEAASKGELDKTSSAKYLDLVPVGMLPQERDGSFRFGVSVFPSLYADALYVLDSELDRIFEVSNAIEPVASKGPGTATRYRALSIGTSVVFKDYDVKIRIDEFFGGHCAILGNTGSGKSCTVATILQSLFEKKDDLQALGASFVFLDVNGEYRKAFSQLPTGIRRAYLQLPKLFSDPVPDRLDPLESTGHFRLPHWFMSVEEWELLLRASEKTQRPVLRTALGFTSLFLEDGKKELDEMKDHLLASCIQAVLSGDAGSPSKRDRILAILSVFHTQKLTTRAVKPLVEISYGEMKRIEDLNTLLQGLIKDDVTIPKYTHVPFSFPQLETAFELAVLYEESHGNRQIRDYCSQMITRFKWIRDREEFAFLNLDPNQVQTHEKSQDSFVDHLLGINRKGKKTTKESQLTILDFNEAADEVVEVGSAVVARMIFERLRSSEPRNALPVNFVLEEAHRYIAEHSAGYAIDASLIFQRIAKEGRKYGMFLVVASQRPSELSKTVLSQCSNFVVHRIQNPDDLFHIRQMTPFISSTVLERLPSLPKQHALIFGNSVNLPTTFRVRDVSPKPDSDDAPIRDLWFIPPGKDLGLKAGKKGSIFD